MATASQGPDATLMIPTWLSQSAAHSSAAAANRGSEQQGPQQEKHRNDGPPNQPHSPAQERESLGTSSGTRRTTQAITQHHNGKAMEGDANSNKAHGPIQASAETSASY